RATGRSLAAPGTAASRPGRRTAAAPGPAASSDTGRSSDPSPPGTPALCHRALQPLPHRRRVRLLEILRPLRQDLPPRPPPAGDLQPLAQPPPAGAELLRADVVHRAVICAVRVQLHHQLPRRLLIPRVGAQPPPAVVVGPAAVPIHLDQDVDEPGQGAAAPGR